MINLVSVGFLSSRQLREEKEAIKYFYQYILSKYSLYKSLKPYSNNEYSIENMGFEFFTNKLVFIFQREQEVNAALKLEEVLPEPLLLLANESGQLKNWAPSHTELKINSKRLGV